MPALISVIIPMYNSEKYIARCIESIINQSFNNIELVIIDDNSDDNSGNIVASYIENYNNIKYIKNSSRRGASYCRNVGLNSINSQYVMFLDSDDWLDLNCLARAIKKFTSNNHIDIVVWEIKTALQDLKISERYQYAYDNVLTSNMALSLLTHSFTNEYFLSPLLGCKLFKTSFLIKNHLKFIDTFYEDDAFSFLALYHANKIGIVTGCNLYYFQHPKSLTHNFSEKHIYDLFKSFKFLYTAINQDTVRGKEHFYKYLQKCINSLLERLEDCVSNVDEINKYKALLLSEFTITIDINEYYKYCSSLVL
ncbi:MAG: glycosyltransferase family 2 protein [Lachnospiraceae bacterium]|nr:glycosyltransferase family 2 protein [Lachnospiraceae bacterium]